MRFWDEKGCCHYAACLYGNSQGENENFRPMREPNSKVFFGKCIEIENGGGIQRSPSNSCDQYQSQKEIVSKCPKIITHLTMVRRHSKHNIYKRSVRFKKSSKNSFNRNRKKNKKNVKKNCSTY